MSGSNGSAIGRFFGILLRLLVVTLLGIVIAAVVYFGAPRAYRGLVEPAQINTSRIDVLEDELGFARDDTSSLRDQTGERLAELEAALAEQAESLATAETQLEQALLASIEQSDAVQSLRRQIRTLENGLDDVSSQLDDALIDIGQPEDELQQDLLINRAMLHLVRARLALLENNAGLAQGEAVRAQALLDQADPEGQTERIQDAIARIDLALEAMQSTPLVAGDDLEIAWKLLIEGEATDE